MVTWDRTPLGLDRRSVSAARCAGCGGIGKTLEAPIFSKVPALHREADRDTTGSFNRQPPVHTWIGLVVQGKRRRPATLRLIRPGSLKRRLTLWFYCGKRAARRHRIIVEPRKSTGFAEMRTVVRRSIAMFRRHRRPLGRIAVLRPGSGRGVKSACCLGCPPCR
jgi:hypothetical protein